MFVSLFDVWDTVLLSHNVVNWVFFGLVHMATMKLIIIHVIVLSLYCMSECIKDEMP